MDEVESGKGKENMVPEIDPKMAEEMLGKVKEGYMDKEMMVLVLSEFFEMKARIKRIEDALTAPGKHVLERSDVYYNVARLLR
ncbi:MAG: hypothetical protein QCI82_04425 [Candidatus Thermoplasmatota archaeon]|nr:hypothetical protein [Candidatus Thermoplasmatota archaeon]